VPEQTVSAEDDETVDDDETTRVIR
jgi:hypothetical protein